MTQVAKIEQSTEVVQVANPAALLQMAVQQGADLDKLEKLMELQERWEKNEARKAFVSAMNEFKANPPTVSKNKHVKFETQKGVTEYDHATLHHVVNVITESLSKYGLSHRWTTEQVEGGGIRVTCVITHVQGHSEQTTLQASADQSGGKNNIQALGSTVTYLQRYTLLAATGMAASDSDDDGKGSDRLESVSEEQALNIQCVIEEIYAQDKRKEQTDSFLRYLSKTGKVDITKISEIPEKMYTDAIAVLERKKKEPSKVQK